LAEEPAEKPAGRLTQAYSSTFFGACQAVDAMVAGKKWKKSACEAASAAAFQLVDRRPAFCALGVLAARWGASGRGIGKIDKIRKVEQGPGR
jgi:hypothetical protein